MRRLSLLIGLVVALWAPNAVAFCGFYVGGAGAELFNDATQVVMMRDGTKTVLSMQNRYDGPVEDFAMVVPVPEVLMEANVKTLENEVFSKIDQLTAPRLVEYFEEDPCYEPNFYDAGAEFQNNASGNNQTNNGGVTVEAQFKVGEYEIVVLGAEQSTGLETWLTENDYNVPTGAGPYYQPYIDAGMYFFVAKVDPAEVTFDGDRAVLSPLRFQYDSDAFQLPVRLGMINSAGQQDLLINIIARNQRYELANYDNVTIPTNLEVTADTKDSFGEFYKTLFARTVAANPGAVITEYAWNASTCDPCPGPSLGPEDFLTLGADTLGADAEYNRDWVVTRLHARYEKDDIGEDLVFQAADPIVGGREFVVGDNGKLEEGAKPGDINNFQGRYIIRHPWDGEIDCEDPTYGVWSSPRTSGVAQSPTTTNETIDVDDAFELDTRLVDDVPELQIEGKGQREAGTTPSGEPSENNASGPGGEGGAKADPGCGGCAAGGPAGPAGAVLLVLFGWATLRGRRLVRGRRA